jgi:hypothetical protein
MQLLWTLIGAVMVRQAWRLTARHYAAVGN